MVMRIVCFIALWSVIFVGSAEAKSKPRVLFAGGAEWGVIHSKTVGSNFYQSGRSMKYYGEIIYRYNGLNHLVFTGGYVMDSLNFRNNNAFPVSTTNGYYSLKEYNVYGLIKTQSALLGVAYLLSIGSNTLGIDLQFGVSGKYTYEALRYGMPNETYEYALHNEIQPFNVFFQPRIALKISYFRFGATYEMPLMDHINHNYILQSRPGESRSADMQGVRMDNPILYLSASMVLPLGKAFKLLNNYAEKKLK